MGLKETPYGLKGPRFKDLLGQKFDKLSVLDYHGYSDKYKTNLWLCKCDCGTLVVRSNSVLTRKKQQHSCGCVPPVPRLPNSQYAFNILYNTYRTNGERRGYKFRLTKDQFRDIIKNNCSYCGASPESRFGIQSDPILANGVDREDNSKDYDVENCVPCCKTCNRAKGTLSRKEFMDWISKAYSFGTTT